MTVDEYQLLFVWKQATGSSYQKNYKQQHMAHSINCTSENFMQYKLFVW